LDRRVQSRATEEPEPVLLIERLPMLFVSLGSRARRFGVFVLYMTRGILFRFVLGGATLVWTACALPETMALRRETTVSIV
jgi:hypothetical protein